MANPRQNVTDTAAPASVPLNEYVKLQGYAVRDAASGTWELGLEVGGARIPLATRKTGHIDDMIKEAANPGFLAERARTYEREVLGRR